MGYMSDDGGDSYNLCHCTYPPPSLRGARYAYDAHTVWSNFEIASMDFWRDEAYTKFFEHLDRTGGFYYEVRSLPSPRRCSS